MSSRRRTRREDRPAVTPDEVAAAVEAITTTHLTKDARYCDELSDDPADMLSHLRKRNRDFPTDIQVADYPHAVVLARWVAENEADRVTLWALEQGKRVGLTNRQVGEPYGLISRQGVPDKIKTLRARTKRPPNTSDQPKHRAAQGGADRQARWLATHRSQILLFARQLLEHVALADEDAADWLAEVARDVEDGACTPASFSVIGFAVQDLAASPAARCLEPGHDLLALVTRWRSLVSEFRNVSA